MKPTIVLILALALFACENHGPLKGVWKQANATLLDCALLQEGTDTLDLSSCLPDRTCPDSIQAQGFTVLPLKDFPGKYQLSQKDTKRNLHPILIWKDGKNITKMGVHRSSLDSLIHKPLTTKGMLNNRLLVSCSGRPSELYVMWQNVLLPKSFLVFTKEGFATLIPIEAKSMEHSHLRIFALNDSLIVFDAQVKLLYGKPVLP